MRKSFTWLVVLLLVGMVAAGCSSGQDNQAAEFRYITAEEVKNNLEQGEPMLLLDIQVEEEWQQHRIQGSIPTHAYPVKTDEEKAKIEAVLPQLEGDDPIVVVCPRGGGGAERAYNFLKEKGISEERLLILEKGMEGWPYDEYVDRD